jgi:NAD(P)-dependent dehydrogenase (short-subunit alcohol dehydrogenase family)
MRKTILITGASSGIGAACVKQALSKDLTIIATARNHEKLQSLKNSSASIHIIAADISTELGRKKICDSINQPIDFLLHNAARLDVPEKFQDITLTDFQSCIATNVEPIIFLTKGLLSNLKQAHEKARILSISSGAAKHIIAGVGNYCISKAAGLMANQMLKVELATSDILVNDYFPGHVNTDMQTKLRSSDDSIFPKTSEFKAIKKSGHLSSPSDIAQHLLAIFTEETNHMFANNLWDFKSK